MLTCASRLGHSLQILQEDFCVRYQKLRPSRKASAALRSASSGGGSACSRSAQAVTGADVRPAQRRRHQLLFPGGCGASAKSSGSACASCGASCASGSVNRPPIRPSSGSRRAHLELG